MIRSRRMAEVGHVTRMGNEKYKILIGKYEGKSSVERQRRKWENNVKTDTEEVGVEGVVFCEHDYKHSCSIKCGHFFKELSMLLACQEGCMYSM
jgi:hypothetical protein